MISRQLIAIKLEVEEITKGIDNLYNSIVKVFVGHNEVEDFDFIAAWENYKPRRTHDSLMQLNELILPIIHKFINIYNNIKFKLS